MDKMGILALVLLCGCQKQPPLEVGYSYDPNYQKSVKFVTSHRCHQIGYSPAEDRWDFLQEEVRRYPAGHEYRCDGVDGTIFINEAEANHEAH